MSIYNILTELSADNSRLAKEAILKKNKSNETLKAVMLAALNPLINYYIRKIPPYTPVEKGAESLEWALEQLNDLSARKVTGNAGIDHLRNILSSISMEDADVIERIISKDLKCGVQESTANKTWKDLIPSYPCMLATGFDKKLIDKFVFPAGVQTKFDGMRFNAIVKNGAVEFRSRNGKQLNLLGNLEPEFLELASGENFVYDGELLIVNPDGTLCNRQEGNGILSKSLKGTLGKLEAERVIAVLWDCIPHSDFVKGRSDLPYMARFTHVSRKLSFMAQKQDTLTAGVNIRRIRFCNTHVAKDLTEAQELYAQALQAGEEGIILKDLNAPWEDKRVKTMIKFKNELDMDLICKEWVPGTGKYEKLLGALYLESVDGLIQVSVGTGFTDEMRNTIKKKDVIGKIITVKYNAEITDKNGKKSLFLPVFVEIREDKNSAD